MAQPYSVWVTVTPGTLQRTMDMTYSTLRWNIANIYLGTIVAFSNFPLEHISHVRTVHTLLRYAGFSLKLNKCRLLSETIDYSEQFIRLWTLKTALHITHVIGELKGPDKHRETLLDLRFRQHIWKIYFRHSALYYSTKCQAAKCTTSNSYTSRR